MSNSITTGGILTRCDQWARLIGAESVLPQTTRFLAEFNRPLNSAPAFDSTVAENGGAFELSISSKAPHVMRILGEARVSGESLISNLDRNVQAFSAISDLHGMKDLKQLLLVIGMLDPPGELLGKLRWRFCFYTALRINDRGSSVRCYFNLLWGSAEHRFLRVFELIRALKREAEHPCISRLPTLFAGWGELVGISCDIAEGKLAPAKLHFAITRHSKYRLALLTNWIGIERDSEMIDWFMSLHPDQSEGHIPYLVSLDIRGDRPTALKLDLVLRGLLAAKRDEIVSQVLSATQADEMGMLLAKIDTRVFKDQVSPVKQYVGLCLQKNDEPYVNVYYSLDRSPVPWERSLGASVARGIDAVRRDQCVSGGFLFQSRDFGSRRRELCNADSDLYMTSLIHQCLIDYWPNDEVDLKRRCVTFIRARREGRGWRYLPSLPLDVDDTAMALMSVECSGGDISEAVDSMVSQQLASGGFRTFFDIDSDPEHFAVTINAVCALWGLRREAAEKGLNYLMRWLDRPDWDGLQWMYSALLPMFLLGRKSHLFGDRTQEVRERIVSVVLGCRRDDGLWGNANPECVEIALALLALGACEHDVPEKAVAIRYLTNLQNLDGTWPWAPMYSDGDGQWFGQAALSTTLCCAALL